MRAAKSVRQYVNNLRSRRGKKNGVVQVVFEGNWIERMFFRDRHEREEMAKRKFRDTGEE